jgi:ketosteroid isomerase-like protein
MATGTTVADNDHDLTETFRQLVEDNLAAFNREDVSATMKYMHTKSPEYGSTQEVLPDQFEALDARTQLVDLHYMGHDDEFAVARVKLKTVDESGAPFAANVLDTIAVFHLEDGVWKYWSDHILGVEFAK